MAEGGTDMDNEDGDSISAGCDEVFDFYCESCKLDSLNVEDGGYCINCEHYLCDTCVNNHKVTQGTRHHTLLSNDRMPKGNPLSSFKVTGKKFTKCEKHGARLEYYCNKHRKPVCHTCVRNKHRHCEQVEYVLPALEGIFNGKEYKWFVKDIERMLLNCRGIAKKAQSNISFAKEHHKGVKETFKSHRTYIDSELDIIEKKIDSRTELFEKESCVKMESIIQGTSDIRTGCEHILKDVRERKATRTAYELFLILKEKPRDVMTMKSRLADIERGNVVDQLFVPEPKELVRIYNVLLPPKTTGKNLEQQQTRVTASHICDIDVSKRADATEINKLTGSVVLPDNRLVIVSRNKCTVKLFDTNSTELLHEMKLPTYPWDVTMLNKTHVAITANSHMFGPVVTSCIYILEIGFTVKYVRKKIQINMEEECRGIAYVQKKLLVTIANAAKLHVIGLDGTVTKTISLARDGRFGYGMFIQPEYICVGKDDRIYMSDRSSGKVVCLNLDGEVLSTYTDTELKIPEKVCVDHKGNVYVSGYGSKNVHMLTADCKKVKSILKSHDGITSPAYTVSYCNTTRRLFVGVSEQNTVKVYQMCF